MLGGITKSIIYECVIIIIHGELALKRNLEVQLLDILEDLIEYTNVVLKIKSPKILIQHKI